MEQLFNADMMMVARQARGVSQTQLARELRMSQSKVSKVELGQIVPGRDFVEKLASVLDFRVSFFTREGRLRPSPANFHRKRQKLSASSWEQILARAEIYRICIEEMLRSVDVQPSRPAPPFIDPDTFDGRVNFIADSVRQTWMLPRGPLDDVAKLIEDSGIIIVPFDFGTELIDAFCQPALDSLPPLIFLNSRFKDKSRIRFSLCHELGHLVMHRIPSTEMEHQANHFAACLLMPEDDIRHSFFGMSLEKLMTLKMHWKTSMQAILLRARDLNRLSDRNYRYYQIELSKRGWRSKEPIEIDGPIETPRLFDKLMQSHVRELDYSVDELGDLFGLNAADMPAINAPERPKLRLVT